MNGNLTGGSLTSENLIGGSLTGGRYKYNI